MTVCSLFLLVHSNNTGKSINSIDHGAHKGVDVVRKAEAKNSAFEYWEAQSDPSATRTLQVSKSGLRCLAKIHPQRAAALRASEAVTVPVLFTKYDDAAIFHKYQRDMITQHINRNVDEMADADFRSQWRALVRKNCSPVLGRTAFRKAKPFNVRQVRHYDALTVCE